MAYLYKRSDWLWPLLIRHRLTGSVWHPLIEGTRRRHLRFRQRLERLHDLTARPVGSVVPAGV